jgi:hypothetical protein
VAHMAFTVEVADLARLSQALKALHGVAGVMRAERR